MSTFYYLFLFCFIFSSLFCTVYSKVDCRKFSKETRSTCELMVEADKAPPITPGTPIDGGPDIMEDRPELNCFTLSCVCPIFNGKTDGSVNGCTLPNGKKLEKCVRKEFRMLTDEERQAYFNAVRHIKDNGAYDLCALQHKDAFNLKGAHRGPAFCPWHRELLKRYEILLREASFQTKQTPDVCLPYWDSTLERQLPTPKDSLLFTETFIGSTNSNNQVTNGPFYPWQTLEIPHGTTHTFIGGLMRDARYAANDPIFFNHHCFVDLIWELYRQKQQTYAQRPVQYPPDIDACPSFNEN
uniref:Tyrosinase_Cu-bd domain-containing protein n=1 Tax=Meloidogyne hapla TaxID=6305 RepID=A0A1I8BFI8_MELHA